MNIVESQIPIADFCIAMSRGEIVVNRNYQRSSKVWPQVARSFLIETILLGYPIPKLFLHQKVDLVSRNIVKEIVDGQQRSMAIKGFYDGEFAISNKSDVDSARGKKYAELNDELKGEFLNYPLSSDVFVAATDSQIRESFRRMNSYTVPLNPEESRHSKWQGDFKWFIYNLTKQFDESIVEMGVLRPQAVVRMADAKLFSEISHALDKGISTTNKSALDSIYKNKDKDFPEKTEWNNMITSAIDIILEMRYVHKTPIVKPFSFYSLVLALIHVANPQDVLQGVYRIDEPINVNVRAAQEAFGNLVALLEEEDEPRTTEETEFVHASTRGTNVKARRETRFKMYCSVLQSTA